MGTLVDKAKQLYWVDKNNDGKMFCARSIAPFFFQTFGNQPIN